MRARRGDTARRARVCTSLWLSSTAAALLVLLAVLFTSRSPSSPSSPSPSPSVLLHAEFTGDRGATAGSSSHVLEERLLTGAATPLRPDVSARTLFSRIQPPLRRVWETRSDAGFELVLPAHYAAREQRAAAAIAYLRHSPDLFRRKTGSLSSRSTSLPPPSV